ncbi:MAG: hypothetical protein VZR73_11875, partial [Acutalibacteraceae bacterium]|nr:hypothetical protein [Acutalibacteraceae bacterium]
KFEDISGGNDIGKFALSVAESEIVIFHVINIPFYVNRYVTAALLFPRMSNITGSGRPPS